MKSFALIFFCFFLFTKAGAQSSYGEAMQQGDAAFKAGQYKLAINKYFAAEAFDPTKKDEVKAKVSEVFAAIEALRQKAEIALTEAKRQTNLALEAKKDAERQKALTDTALKEARKQTNLALESKKEAEKQTNLALEAKKEADNQKDIAQQALKRNIEFQEKSVGKKYKGGIIFHVNSARDHGLIAAEKDLDSAFTWEEAKEACRTYSVTVDGITYNNWHLPSKDELVLLFINREAVGGFFSDFYWSSTEDDNGYQGDAWGKYFSVDAHYNDWDYNKNRKNRVRPIHAF